MPPAPRCAIHQPIAVSDCLFAIHLRAQHWMFHACEQDEKQNLDDRFLYSTLKDLK
jgi:hypothetical protein